MTRRRTRRSNVYLALWKAFKSREFTVDDAARVLLCSRHCAWERLRSIDDHLEREGRRGRAPGYHKLKTYPNFSNDSLDALAATVQRLPPLFTIQMFLERERTLSYKAARLGLRQLCERGDLFRVGRSGARSPYWYSTMRWGVTLRSPLVLGLAVRFGTRPFRFREAKDALAAIGRTPMQFNAIANGVDAVRVGRGKYRFSPEFVELARAFFDSNGIKYDKETKQ